MSKTLKKCPAVFYQSGNGAEPVREWLFALSKKDRKVMGEDIATVEYGADWYADMPPLGKRALGDTQFTPR